jgi:hypothetical protein
MMDDENKEEHSQHYKHLSAHRHITTWRAFVAHPRDNEVIIERKSHRLTKLIAPFVVVLTRILSLSSLPSAVKTCALTASPEGSPLVALFSVHAARTLREGPTS